MISFSILKTLDKIFKYFGKKPSVTAESIERYLIMVMYHRTYNKLFANAQPADLLLCM